MIFSILSRPYPLVESPLWRFVFWLGAALFVDLFLIVFQPFGTDTFEHAYKYLFLSGYGGIVLFVFGGLDALVLPFFDESRWIVGKQILWLLLEVILTITLCFFYLVWFTQIPIDWSGYISFVFNSSAIALFPIVALVLAHYVQQLQKYKSLATTITKEIERESTESASPSVLKILGENKKDVLEFYPSELYYIKAANNYTEFYLYKEDKLQKTLLRNSLTKVEQQIDLVKEVVRCHRSYLVNLDKVKKVSGNAQGYTLHLQDIVEVVPVARSKGKQVIERLKPLIP
ncbi:MAG: LytTR family transcriptional regulator [Aureispira sp.]|nr:LytTR family transcriptional regulator [Aureispira sp.]